MGVNPGKYYENRSMEAVKDLFKSSFVHGERRIPTDYGEFRKVDIGVNQPGNYDYLIFECKDEKRPTGVSSVDQVLETMKDVGASKCAIITNNSVTAGALKKSLKRGVDVFNLIDPADEKIRPKLLIPVYSKLTWLAEYDYSGEFADQAIDMPYPPKKTLLSEDGTVHNLVCCLWNSNELDSSSGTHEYNHGGFNVASCPDRGLISMPLDEITIRYKVVSKCFLTKEPLIKGFGLYDVHRSQFINISTEIAVGPMTIENLAVEKNVVTVSPELAHAVFVGELKHVMDPLI